MHQEAGCSQCGTTVVQPGWIPLGPYPPDRYFLPLHRDQQDHCWIVRCHGCILHKRLQEIEGDLQVANERADTQRSVALHTWRTEERRQIALRAGLDQAEEWERKQIFARARLTRHFDEYTERLQQQFGGATAPAGTDGQVDPAQALQGLQQAQPAEERVPRKAPPPAPPRTEWTVEAPSDTSTVASQTDAWTLYAWR